MNPEVCSEYPSLYLIKLDGLTVVAERFNHVLQTKTLSLKSVLPNRCEGDHWNRLSERLQILKMQLDEVLSTCSS